MDLWIDMRGASELLGVCENTIRKRILPLIDEDAVRTGGRRHEYRVDALVRAHGDLREEEGAKAEQRKRDKAAADVRAMPDGELLLGDGGEALERLRHWKAKLAEDEYRTRRKELIEREAVVGALGVAHGGLRRLIERWDRRQRGAEAQELRDAIAQGVQALRALCGGVDHEEMACDDGETDGILAGGGNGAAGGGGGTAAGEPARS